MILFSVGLPGRFAAWCDAAIARLIEIGLGPVAVVGAEVPDEVAGNLVRSTTPYLVIASRRPIPALRALLTDSRSPVIVALDDPRRGLYELVAEQGQDIRAATRVMAESCAAALVCGTLPGAVAIHADRARREPAWAIGLIGESAGGPPGPGDTASVLAAAPFPSDAGPDDAWWGSLDPSHRVVAEGALAGYAESFRGGRLGDIVWDRTLFWLAADPARNAGVAIDLGNAAGPLISGPEIGLPPGNWAASVTLAVSKEAIGVGFDIAVQVADHPDPLATAGVVPDARGLCSATLPFTIASASGQTISLTVANTAPAPGGRLALGNVLLVPSPGEVSGIPSELTTVLGL